MTLLYILAGFGFVFILLIAWAVVTAVLLWLDDRRSTREANRHAFPSMYEGK